ncbi:MAG TPA: SRPBCC family protein [bacterium]
MTRIEKSIIIQAPVEQVFAYAADYTKWGEWFEGISDIKATTEVTRGNGARYAYKARLMGVSASVETEIRDFVPNSGWTGIGIRGMEHKTHWAFGSVGQGTKFTYALEYKLPVPLIACLLDSLFMRPQWEKIIRKSLDNLRLHFQT